MPTPSRLRFLAAVFFLFAPLAIVLESGLAPDSSWSYVLGGMLVSGLVAVGFAAAVLFERRLFVVVVPASIALAVLRGRQGPEGVSWPAVLAVGLIVVGYVFFVAFVRREGARSVRMQTEMKLAQEIHSHLVPPVELHRPGLELCGRSLPSSEMGGDLLDVVEREGCLLACLGDVSGHGVGAAVVMAMVKSALHMRLLGSDELPALLDDLSRVVHRVRSRGTFVTLGVMRFDGSPTVQFALAGHLPILHFRAGSGVVEELATPSPPLGVFQARERIGQGSRYRALVVRGEPGDLFVLLSDGLVEVRNDGGVELGFETVKGWVADCGSRPLDEIRETIFHRVAEHGDQADDQTVLLVRLTA